jgi:hypothetical protein
MDFWNFVSRIGPKKWETLETAASLSLQLCMLLWCTHGLRQILLLIRECLLSYSQHTTKALTYSIETGCPKLPTYKCALLLSYRRP